MEEHDVAVGWRRFQRNWIPIALMSAVLALCLAVTDFSIELSGLAFSLAFVALYGGFAYANAYSKSRRDPQVIFVLGSIAREKLPDGREIVRYSSPEDLIYKTPGFYEYVARDRINRKLGAADRWAEAHFDGPNLYQTEIDSNMSYLREAIESADLNRLRRTCYSLSNRYIKAA